MSPADEARERLRACAEDRHQAVLALADARSQLRALRPELELAIHAGHAHRIPIAEIARLAQVTRQTVYTILRRKP